MFFFSSITQFSTMRTFPQTQKLSASQVFSLVTQTPCLCVTAAVFIACHSARGSFNEILAAIAATLTGRTRMGGLYIWGRGDTFEQYHTYWSPIHYYTHWPSRHCRGFIWFPWKFPLVLQRTKLGRSCWTCLLYWKRTHRATFPITSSVYSFDSFFVRCPEVSVKMSMGWHS